MFCKINKVIIFFFLFFFYANQSFSLDKVDIINNFIKIKNFSFSFNHKIKNKIETGDCVIKYPKLIYCLYDGNDKKEIVSNGKTLVIKTKLNNNYYIYPLKTTSLEYILDKKYLINKIKLHEMNKNKDFIFFKIINNISDIKIFFNLDTFDIMGWETFDIYGNEISFKIKNIKKNIFIDNNKFLLPSRN